MAKDQSGPFFYANQTPEQAARDRIDARLRASGWHVQDKDALDFNAGPGIAVREYQTDIGPADYVLFADRQAVGVIEAKPDTWGVRLTAVEEQSEGYANARLKWITNAEPLPFLYESTGQITRFTNARDPNPRSREVFSFHRPETLQAWMQAPRPHPGRARSPLQSRPRRLAKGPRSMARRWREGQETCEAEAGQNARYVDSRAIVVAAFTSDGLVARKDW